MSKQAWRASTVAVTALAIALTGCTPASETPGGDPTAEAVKLSFSTFLGEDDANSKAMQWFMKEVEDRTNGQVTFDAYYGGSLIGAAESLAAAADGRVDIAILGSFYHQSELPLTTVVELPMVSTNTPAQSAALQQLYRTDSEYKSEFDKAGVQLLWPGVLSTAIIGTEGPIESASDLRGIKIRAGGLSGRFLADLGADIVEIPSSEIYQGMQTGLIEAYASIVVSQVPQFGLTEVTGYVTDGWYGGFAVAPFVINSSRYNALPGNVREVIDDVAGQMVAKSAELLHEVEGAACEALAAADVEVVSISEALRAELAPKAAQYEQQWLQDRASASADIQGFLQSYRSALAQAESEFSAVRVGAARCDA